MKPRMFIGSSVESLDLANVIQENLDYDATTTVWNQGIFELSNSTLESLVNALENFDFGVFVFSPDDISQIRKEKLNTVRDNVIFEFGLFIGKLGRNKVFFVIPRETADFHLPSDLLGITSGVYDNKREDGNVKAALGPFCNQVRERLKKFTYENLVDLANENDIVKKIAIEKRSDWELRLSSELLKSRLEEINRSFLELEKGLVFQKTRRYSFQEYKLFVLNSLTDLSKVKTILTKVFEEELLEAFGEPGRAGNVFEIKSAVDKIASICKELLAWEYDLHSIIVPEELSEAQDLMKGWSKLIFDEINKFPGMVENALSQENGEILIKLEFVELFNVEKVGDIILEKER
jgi:predicted nucleotide-binding protein